MLPPYMPMGLASANSEKLSMLALKWILFVQGAPFAFVPSARQRAASVTLLVVLLNVNIFFLSKFQILPWSSLPV